MQVSTLLFSLILTILCVAVSNAAGQLGAAPAQYYRGPLPTGAQVGVMEMMKGGCPGPQFLGESKKNAELFGACIGRFHGVDPAVLAPFEQVNSIKPDTAAILKQELGVDDHELAQIESICGTMPGRFSQILLLRQQGAHPAFLQRIGAAIKRTCLGACSWLSHPVAKRMVVGHADVNHNNLMYKDADYMVAIDFESARLMPAVFDLGAMLLDVNRAGISTFAVPRLHREAMVQAYKRLMPSGTEESTPVSTDGVLLDDRIDDLLWDMEVGMLFRLCYITIAAPIISRTVQKPTDQFVAALEVMLTAMEDAASDPTKKDAIIDRGLVAHCFVKEESVPSPGDGEKTNFI